MLKTDPPEIIKWLEEKLEEYGYNENNYSLSDLYSGDAQELIARADQCTRFQLDCMVEIYGQTQIMPLILAKRRYDWGKRK